MKDSIFVIQEAFDRIWRRATNQPHKPGDRALMSIPVDEKNDADCIMHRAIQELLELRTKLSTKEAQGDGE